MQSSQVTCDEEAFLIRRIAEYWKDGDYQIVKTQILDFFDKYPESQFKDYFSAILGDIYLQESSYEKALYAYQTINQSEIKEKIILNKLQSYYELNQFDHLIREGRPLIGKDIESLKGREKELYFLVAEGCFRQALEEKRSDVKLSLAREARDYYDQLVHTPYSEASTFVLAEIYAILGEREKSVEAYLDLAKQHPEMKEDLLFQAGILQSQFDRPAAIETFNEIKKLRGHKAGDATFNFVVLLFQNQDYAQIISDYQELAPSIPQSYQPTFHFILGKSFFSTGNYQSAIDFLSRYIDAQYVPTDQLKSALLIQMTCAHQTADEPLFHTMFEKLETFFPDDQEISKALFMHAMILKEQGAVGLADQKLIEIKEKYQDFEDQESFLFEYGFLAHQNDRWEESYQTFKHYLATYPQSKRIDTAWKLFLSSSLNLYKLADENDLGKKGAFFKDLKHILVHHDFLTSEEMKDYSLLYAKIAYEMGDYSDALRILQNELFAKLKKEEDPLTLSQAHFIAGLCHTEIKSNPLTFCNHLEEAIILNPQMYDTSTTHLQLYNAYISLAGYGESEQNKKAIENEEVYTSYAANHLQKAIDQGQIGIKRENRLWLANHYFNHAKAYLETHWTHKPSDHIEIASAIDHAMQHYKYLLYEDGFPIELSGSNLYLEDEFLKLSKLMQYCQQHEERFKLIKNLIEQQSQKPYLQWGVQKEALFELAKVYQDLGDLERAYETFHFIHSSSDYFPLDLSHLAVLESARLHFHLLEDECKTESNKEFLSILNDLKELQIRKNVSLEPIHLEAALDYASIRSEVGDPAEKDARYLFFLKRMEEDFTSKEDLVTQDYLMNLAKNGDKKQIFDTYMKFIQAERYRVKAKNLYNEQRLGEMDALHLSALKIYHEIQSNHVTPKSLYERVTTSIQEINTLKTY